MDGRKVDAFQHDLFRFLANELQDLVYVPGVGRGHDHKGAARLASPARASDPVYVVFGVVGNVIVEDVADIGDVEAPGGDI